MYSSDEEIEQPEVKTEPKPKRTYKKRVKEEPVEVKEVEPKVEVKEVKPKRTYKKKEEVKVEVVEAEPVKPKRVYKKKVEDSDEEPKKVVVVKEIHHHYDLEKPVLERANRYSAASW